MTRLNNHVLVRTANANAMTIFVVCALLIALGVGVTLLRIINIGRKKNVASIMMMDTTMIRIKTWTVLMT